MAWALWNNSSPSSLPPLPRNKGDPVFLISEHHLPLAGKEESSWGCSLSWLPSSPVWGTTPTFYMTPAPGAEGRVNAQLVVGCTNGQVLNLQWEISGVNGVVGLVSSSVGGVTGVCSITGVSGGVSGCVSKITSLWEEADGVPVYTITCQPKVSDSFLSV